MGTALARCELDAVGLLCFGPRQRLGQSPVFAALATIFQVPAAPRIDASKQEHFDVPSSAVLKRVR